VKAEDGWRDCVSSTDGAEETEPFMRFDTMYNSLWISKVFNNFAEHLL